MKKKHAFLIMTQEVDLQLQTIISTLDDPYNDFFIHVDADSNKCRVLKTKYSNIYFCKHIEGNWAAFSLVKIELELLRSAVSVSNYEYLHLISGNDLPLKSSSFIHEKLSGCNLQFIEFQEINTLNVLKRIEYYYPFQEYIGKKHGFLWFSQKLLFYIQKTFGIRKRKILFDVGKGSQWFSITYDFANYVISKEKYIYEFFSGGQAVDEVFIQTLCLNSKFKYDIANLKFGNLRYINWKRKNSPEVLSLSDLPNLYGLPEIFARKFFLKKENYNLFLKYQKIERCGGKFL